jgi:hypothetical protein
MMSVIALTAGCHTSWALGKGAAAQGMWHSSWLRVPRKQLLQMFCVHCLMLLAPTTKALTVSQHQSLLLPQNHGVMNAVLPK